MYNQNEIGLRLRTIRDQYLIGIKISTNQFAELVGEPKHNIAAYESGKANIPNRVFVALYDKGINPIYILTGEGSVYAPNKAGTTLSESLKGKIDPLRLADVSKGQKGNEKPFVAAKANSSGQNQVQKISKLNVNDLSIEELLSKAEQFTAAAGDIMKIVNHKKNK
jgi:hypothetical protein